MNRAEGDEQALVVGLLRSLSAFRWVTLLWAIAGAALSTEHLEHDLGAITLLTAMVVTTIAVTLWPRRSAMLPPTAWWVVVVELIVGATVLVGDGLVYADSRPQSIAWAWPAAGVMAAGILFGTRAGLLAAAVTGGASMVSEVGLLDRDTGWVGALSKLGLWMLAGTLAGYVVERLRRAEAEISVVRAREEVARQLHDGVLQTLAVIQRRSGDEDLAALARDQEHDLRGFLSGTVADVELFEPEVRRLAARHEAMFGGHVHVVIAADLPIIDRSRLSALTGAVGEALTNAGKHGDAQRITIYAEPADRDVDADHNVFVSVKDDGSGFDIDTSTERIGLGRSVRGRIIEIGGSVDIDSQPGRGTEVKLWI